MSESKPSTVYKSFRKNIFISTSSTHRLNLGLPGRMIAMFHAS
jgi:hypothetical protein